MSYEKDSRRAARQDRRARLGEESTGLLSGGHNRVACFRSSIPDIPSTHGPSRIEYVRPALHLHCRLRSASE